MGIPEKNICFLTTPKTSSVWIETNCGKFFFFFFKLWKILKEMPISDCLTCLLRNLYEAQEATEPDLEQLTVSKLRKEYDNAVYYHAAYLI